jgi:hypothetical protein
VRFDGLDPNAFHLLSVNVPPIEDLSQGRWFDALAVRIDGRTFAGPLSMHIPGWRTWPVPRSLVGDGLLEVEFGLFAGQLAGVAEVLLRSLPISIESVAAEDGAVMVGVRSSAGLRPSDWSLWMLHPEGRRGRQLVLEALEGQLARYRVPANPGEDVARLLLEVPSSPTLDIKLFPFAEASTRRHAAAAPGHVCIAIDGGAAQEVVVTVPGNAFPAGRHRLAFLDAHGVDVSGAMAIDAPSPRLRMDGRDLVVAPDATPEDRLVVRHSGSEPLLLDRLVGYGRAGFEIALESR